MRRTVLGIMVITGLSLLFSCGDAGEKKIYENRKEKIKQEADGTLSLKVDNANCYSDVSNPSGNTAEWSVVVSKTGRYDVWISSATRDTTNLMYQRSVLVSIADKNIEAKPECDRIIRNSSEVDYPWFRADSFLGSIHIPDTGVHYVQVVSEKIFPKNYNPEEATGEDISKLISVFFTPATR